MKKIIPLIITLILIFGAFPVAALAADTPESINRDGLVVTLTTDKTDYTSEEPITATVTVTNTNDVAVSGIRLSMVLAESLKLQSNELPNIIELEAGESAKFVCTVVSIGIAAAVTGGSPDTNIGEAAENPASDKSNQVASGFGWWWIVLAAVLAGIVAVLVIFRKKILKLFKRSFSLFMIFAILISIFVPFVAPVNAQAAEAVNNSDNKFSVSQTITIDGVSQTITVEVSYAAVSESDTTSPEMLTVKFETNGGSAVSPMKVKSGRKLSTIPTPAKTNSAFTGWFTDKKLDKRFYSDQPITRNMTLYASYSSTQTPSNQYIDPEYFVDNCNPNYAISIASPVALTSANLSSYVQTSTMADSFPALNVTGSGGIYTISPATPYEAAETYQLTLTDNALSFQGMPSDIRTWSFRIHKDSTSILDLNDDITYVLWSDVEKLGDDAYLVPAALNITKDDTVCFWDGTVNNNTLFCRVLLAEAQTGAGGEALTLLTTKSSDFSDILEDVDLCGEKLISPKDYINQINTQEIAEAVKSSEGTQQLTRILAGLVSESPTVQNMMSSASGVFDPVEENYTSEIVRSLADGLTVTIKTGTARNPNFNPFPEDPDYPKDFDHFALTLIFDYQTCLKDKINLHATFTVTEYLGMVLCYNIETDYSYDEFIKANLPEMDLELAIDSLSQTDVDLTIKVWTVDTSEDDYIDITEEIEELTDPGNEEDGGVADILQQVLGAKGEYIELLNQNLVSIPMVVLDFFVVDIELNFVVKVNFAAGINAHTTLLSARRVGIKGGTNTEMQQYNHKIPGDNRYSFDFFAAGYLGFKTGLNLSVNFYVVGLESLGKVGFSGELGAYLDIYGFLHLQISKPYDDVYKNEKGEYEVCTPTFSIEGGVYMELGVYIELKIFAKSDWFKAKAEHTLYEHKFPVYNLGNQYQFLKFTNSSQQIAFNTPRYPLQNAAGLLEAEYIDLTTGIISTRDHAAFQDFEFKISSNYLNCYNKEIYTFNIGGQNRIDATMDVYYKGSGLSFSYNQKKGATYKTVDLIWLNPSNPNLDISNAFKFFKATYIADYGSWQKQIMQKDVRYGAAPGFPGYTVLSDFNRYGEISGYTGDFNQPILQDTVYTIHFKPKQKLVSFITYYGGKWHLDVYPVNMGEKPVVPVGYDSSGAEGIFFTEWTSAYGWGLTPSGGALKVDSPVTQASSYDYYGLDTTKPYYSASGSYEECIDKYYEGSPGYADRSVYLFKAQYRGSQKYTVDFIYPAMSYSYRGTPINCEREIITKEFGFNEIIRTGQLYTGYYPGCDFLGWDADNDGVADYAPNIQLPTATQNMTLTAILQFRTYTVKVLDADGNLADTLTANEGSLPSIINTSPAYPGVGEYNFKYWALSKAGGAFAEWKNGSDPGVFADWTIKPVYNKLYTITFDYVGGRYNGEQSETLKLEAGTYKVTDVLNATPVKDADIRNTYAFDGWDCGESFTIAGDATIKAVYKATAIPYTVEYYTASGTFSNGESTTTYTGDYDSWLSFRDGFLELHPMGAYKTNTVDKTYTLDRWDISWDGLTKIRYEAVWTEAPRNYTVTFDAGDGSFSSTGGSTRTQTVAYNASGDFTTYNADIVVKPTDEYFTYKHTGWIDQLGQHYNLTDGYTIQGDTTFTAVFETDQPIIYTISLLAAGGIFLDDGSTTKNYTGRYGEDTNINVADPYRVSPDPASYHYVFDGWSSDIPATFTENVTITAQWRTTDEYTITFDANGGAFTGGDEIVTQTYHYNDTITPPDDPVKADDDDYTYAFIGWSSSFGPVTDDVTYKAHYRGTLKGGLPAAGITVSDGTDSETVSSSGSISGYTYALEERDSEGDIYQIPALTITGDSLAFSGFDNDVYIIIDSGCSSVSFDNLELSGKYPFGDGMLVIPYVETSPDVTINILGNCKLENTSDYAQAIWSRRPIVLNGQGTDATLSISSIGLDATYVRGGIETNNLTLNVTAAAGTLDPSASAVAFNGDGGSTAVWRFVDSDVTARGMGVFNLIGNVTIEGDSQISLVSTDNTKPVLLLYGSESYLQFVNFTGGFSASYLDTEATGPAVLATSGITFTPDIGDYDLNGAGIDLYTYNMNSYYTFLVGAVPQSNVHVTRP